MKLNRRNLLLASSATITLTLSAPSTHAGQIWDGGGSTGIWGNQTNWDSDTLPDFSNPITFAGNVTTTNQNNLAANTTVGGINFTNNGTNFANAFTLQGANATTTNSMILGGNITTTASSSAFTDIIHASLDIVLNGNHTITTDTSHNLTINGRISETGGNQSITKEGAGVLTIGGNTSLSGGNNTFTGGIIINNGVVQLTANGTRPRAAGTGTITLGATSGNNTAELRSAGGYNVTNDIIVNAGSSGTKTIANRSTNSNTFGGNITANDDLTIVGANGGGSFIISGTANTIANGKTVSFVSSGSSTSNFSNSALWSGNGSISYTGSNILNLLVINNKTYSGGTTLGAMAGNATNGHLIASGNSTFNGSTFDGNGTLIGGLFGTGTLSIGATKMRTNFANTTIGNAVSFIDNATFVTAATEETLIFSGNTSLGNVTRILTVDTGSTQTTKFLQFSGQISGTDAAAGITKAGTGNLLLSGNNTFTGGVTINAGVLRLGNAGALNSTAASENAVTFGASSTGILSLSGNSVTIRSLTSNDTPGTPVVQNANAGNATLTVGNSLNLASSFAGVIQDGSGGGTLGLTKAGTNTLTLSGNNTHTGATTISAGTLVVNGSTANSTFALNSGTLTGNGTVGAVTVANSASAILSNNNGVAGASLTTGNLAFNGASTVNLFSNGTSTSALIAAGALSSNAAGNVTINASATSWTNGSTFDLISYTGGSIGGAGFGKFVLGTVNGTTARQTATFGNSTTAITLAIAGDTPYWTGAAGSNWNTSDSNWKLVTAGNVTQFLALNDTVLFDDLGGNRTININAANLTPNSVVFNNSSGFDYTIGSTGGFGIASGSLTKNNTGNVTLTGNNTYTGATTINGGRLIIADGSIASSSNIVNNAALEYNLNANARTYANVISGNGTLTKSGTNTLTLSGLNSFTGNLSVDGGTLLIGVAGGNGTSALGSVANTRTITIGANATLSTEVAGGIFNNNFSFPASGLPGLVINGGLMTNGGNATNSALGNLTLNSGTLNHTTGRPFGTESGQGFGAWNLNGTITSTGASFITSGNASVPVTLSADTGNGNITTFDVQSGTLTASAVLGEVTRTGSERISGLTKTGTGTLRLTAANAYSGLTTISGGILRITSGTALGNTTQGVTIVVGGALEIDGTGGAVIVGAEAVTMTGGGIGNTGAIRNIAGDNTWGGAITIATSSARINSDSGTLLLNSATAVSSGGNRNLVIGGEGNVTIASGINLGTGGAQISKDGNGTLTLSGNNTSNHNSNGGLNINAGNVNLGSANALNSTAGSENGVTFFGANSTGILNLAGNSVIIRSLNGNTTAPGTPVVQNASAANATLTVGNSKNLASTFAGVIQDGSGGGTLGLTKAGTGNLTLSGNNTYTGNTTVNAGVLAVTGTSIADTGTLVINAGTVDLTNTETVATLFFGATPQPSGNYSSSSVPGGANITNASFTGNGTLIVGGGAPSSPYATWSGGAGFYADANGDGVPNGMTWLLGGANTTSNGLALLPAPVVSGGNMTLNFITPTPTAPAQLFFEYGNNLVEWTPVQVPAANATVGSVTFAVTPANGTTNNVAVTVNGNASVGGKLFGRFNSKEN
jgi:autotransporter-associated beta strand protein